MKKQHQKLITDLQRLLETQNFASEEELNKFMDSLKGQTIPSFPKEALSFKELAQDLVFEAYEVTPAKAKANITKALQLDPDRLYTMGKVKECVAVLEEMIELNTNDNQGVRDQLLLYLIQLDENKKFMKYAKMYKEDSLAFSLFNRALFAFKTEGKTENSNKLLLKALKQNKFVAKRLLSNEPVNRFPVYYGLGDEHEADYYAYFAHNI